MHCEWKKEHWIVSTDPARLDKPAVHAFLASCYWCQGIPRETVERALANSLCFGLFDGAAQVGLARVVTDYATFAYLCDVYVLESHRGRGLGKWLIECVMAHPQLQGLRRFNLVTKDAHQLYVPFGFTPLAAPERHMEKHNPGIYKTAVSGEQSGAR
jgi:GNAT superfamily N-acetyltransferase